MSRSISSQANRSGGGVDWGFAVSPAVDIGGRGIILAVLPVEGIEDESTGLAIQSCFDVDSRMLDGYVVGDADKTT